MVSCGCSPLPASLDSRALPATFCSGRNCWSHFNFFANPSKPTFDAQFRQFMYVISKPKKPGTGNPAGKQIANFVPPPGCGRAGVRTCGHPRPRHPDMTAAHRPPPAMRPDGPRVTLFIFKKNWFLFSFLLGMHGNSHRHQQTTCCYTRT